MQYVSVWVVECQYWLRQFSQLASYMYIASYKQHVANQIMLAEPLKQPSYIAGSSFSPPTLYFVSHAVEVSAGIFLFGWWNSFRS
jgi:hypothetical protein